MTSLESSPLLFVDVIPLRGMWSGYITYSVPSQTENIFPGQVVEIPVRGKREQGIVRFVHSNTPDFPTKTIGAVLTSLLFSETDFRFLERLSSETFSSLGRFFSLLLPKKILQKSGVPPQEKVFWLSQKEMALTIKKRKQFEALKIFLERGEEQTEHSLKNNGVSAETLRTLQKKEILSADFREREFPVEKIEKIEDVSFSPEELRELSSLREAKKVFLMGSSLSKRNRFTFQRILDILKTGKTVLFLVPDILFLERTAEKFRNLLGKEAVLEVHSGISETTRFEIWWKMRRGFPAVVIGTRAALFLPFQNLGLVIAEDPQDTSFKSILPPIYHAQKAAEILAEEHNVPLLFQTIAPEVSFLKTALSSKEWKMIRFEEQHALPIHIVDMKKEIPASARILSEPLQRAIRETLARKKNVLLYINRRGLFPAVLCPKCGFSPKCVRDHTPLVLHKKNEEPFLLCHTCAHSEGFPKICPECKKSPLREFGIGTQRVESEVRSLFPEAKIVRIDRDTTPTLKAVREKIQAFELGEYNILIGTKGIIRGAPLSSIETIGSILAESDLSFPNFRVSERAFHTFLTLFDRGDRTSPTSQIFLQTYFPDHLLLKDIVNRDYQTFLNRELHSRETLFLPPFSDIIKIDLFGKDLAGLLKKAEKEKLQYETLAKSLFPGERFSCSILPTLSQIRQIHRVTLFLFGKNLRTLLEHSLPKNATIDISPEGMEEAFSLPEYSV